ncbi:phosphatidylinositol-specific phospholipase C1-like protein [Aquisphaera insulae]|uniref:phosphatidylinositol-specific phospholipase C1-like protein n=1 Tax=Aquisphaera insulae TaxID=2712864 RepID=UPI0013EB63D9|nr:phosphatidylinositol-specific phospholipase C1-like protein [Aquisphaera insulae]
MMRLASEACASRGRPCSIRLRFASWPAGLAAWLVLMGASTASAQDGLRWNQIQVIGSHNSYHIAPADGVRSLIAATGEKHAQGLDYTHPPLAQQFSERGIRQVELDLFHDPEGGRYARPRAREILRLKGTDAGPDPDARGELGRPGLKIFHVPDIDFRSTAPTLTGALKQVREWSDAHPRHVPLFILLELKGSSDSPLLSRPLPFDRKALEGMEAEILSVLDRSKILTPADVRGDAATLAEAVRKRGWPLLGAVRGRIVLALDNEDAVRDDYLAMHPRLDGQLLFVSVPEDHPQAAWFKINDVIADFDRIRNLVAAGFLVRTRADIDTREARSNDPTRRDRALASGAQFVSTDYPVADPRLSSYCVQLPGRVAARPNPVSAPGRGDSDLEGNR